MKFVQYINYTEHGEILMTGAMPESDMAIQRGNFIEGTARLGLDRVVDGTVVALPERPSPFHKFDYIESVWVLDAREAWANVRHHRDQRITSTDWTILPDVPLSAEQRAAWAAYRQALRDITDQPDPTNIVWPVKPE